MVDGCNFTKKISPSLVWILESVLVAIVNTKKEIPITEDGVCGLLNISFLMLKKKYKKKLFS